MLDYSKFVIHSDCPGFKNDYRTLIQMSVSGQTGPGVNNTTVRLPIPEEPDYVDLQFNGNVVNGVNVISSTAWKRKGTIAFKGNGGIYVDHPVEYRVFWYIEGTEIVINLVYEQQFSQVLTLTTGPFNVVFANYSHT